jgi:hypothetical protein
LGNVGSKTGRPLSEHIAAARPQRNRDFILSP